MRATPDEVIPLHVPFDIALRGFNRQQVLDHIESLEGRMAMIATDREAALKQVADLAKLLDYLRREVEEAHSRVERLQRSSLGGAGVRLQRMLQIAEDEITALQVSTEQETTALRERTRAEADRLLRETTERCARLEAESEQRRRAQEAASAAKCQQAEQESEQRRRAAEEHSEREIARREAEAMARMREYQVRSVGGIHLLLRIAGERLSNRLATVEREIAKFRELRADVTARLSSAHSLLENAVDQVHQPLEIEQDELPRSLADLTPVPPNGSGPAGPGPAGSGPAGSGPAGSGPAGPDAPTQPSGRHSSVGEHVPQHSTTPFRPVVPTRPAR